MRLHCLQINNTIIADYVLIKNGLITTGLNKNIIFNNNDV